MATSAWTSPLKGLGTNLKKLDWYAKILITLGAIIVIVLNIQPFTELGNNISQEIETIPLIDTISSFPILGKLFGGFIENLLRWFLFSRGDLISLAMWGVVNYLELLHLFFDGNLWLSIAAYIFEFVVNLFKYEIYGSGYEDFFKDFWWWNLEDWNWFQLMMMIVSIFGGEIGLGVLKNMWTSRKD